MLIRDNVYPSRTLYKNDILYQFHNSVADLPTQIALELLSTGEYAALNNPETDKQSISDRPLKFNPSSWSLDKKLILETPLDFHNGYGKSGRMMAEALSDVCDLYVIGSQTVDSPSEKLKKILSKRTSDFDSFYIKYSPADSLKPLAERMIPFTMFECTRIPFTQQINDYAERCLVPCKANKRDFIDSGVTRDIEVIALGIIPENYPLLERDETEEFIFGMEGTLTFRKGVDLAIKAFKEAFPKDKYPKVGLYIKTTANGGIYYKKEADEDPRITLNIEWVSEQELLHSFYKQIDAYLFLSRGEGFGMTTIQAMSTGLPVIATMCGGLEDHINNNVAYPVKVNLVDVPNRYSDGRICPYGYPENLQADGQQWWEADIKDAVRQMRNVYEERDKAKRKGLVAHEYIKNNYDVKFTAQKIINYLNKKF